MSQRQVLHGFGYGRAFHALNIGYAELACAESVQEGVPL